MNNEQNLNNVLEQVKNVDNGINGVLIPILKDTIDDCNHHNTKLFILAIIELLVILILGTGFSILIYKQNIEYNNLLSQFEFETEYVQDVDTSYNYNSTISPDISVIK